MGQIDTLIRYGRHNTYALDPHETLYADPFAVDLYSTVTSQLVAIKPGGSASGEIGLRWINAQNKRMGADEIYTFPVSDRFSDFWKAVDVPSDAVKLQWGVKAGSTGFNFGCAKVGPGTLPTAFDENLAERTAWHTVDGSYVHFLSADQIVAGVLRSVLGDSGFDLEKPEIWMTSEDGKIIWKASPDNPLQILDQFGNLLAGVISKGDQVGLISSFIGNASDGSGGYGSIGWGTSGGLGFQFEHGEHVYMFSFDTTYGVQLYIDNILRQSWDVTGGHVLYDLDGRQRFSINGTTGEITIRDKNDVARFVLESGGGTVVRDKNGKTRFHLLATGENEIVATNGQQVFLSDNTKTEIIAPTTSGMRLGVDATSPYFVRNGTRFNF